jgi:hypothetical protein
VKIPGMEVVDPQTTAEVPSAELETNTEVDIPEETIESPYKMNGEDRKANFPRFYLMGGSVLLLALLAVTAWFVVNPRTTVVEPEILFEPIELGSRWFTSRPLPESLSAASAVAIGTDVYVIGGRQSDGTINAELHVYDSAGRVWHTAAAKPQPSVNSAAVPLVGLIYVVGGETADGQESDIVEVYSPAADTWQQAASLPKAISDGLVVTDGAQLYHLGGRTNGVATDDAYLFNPATNAWQTLPNMPESRSGATGGAISGNLYIIGGANSAGDPTSDCFKFNLSENNWDRCTPMSNNRVNAGGAVILNKLYVIGGETGASFGELYNPNSDIWEKIDQPMLAGLDTPSWSNASVASVEARVYMLGGEFNGTLSSDAYFFSPLVYQSFIPSASSTD